MLEKSDTGIGDTLKVFNAFDLDVGLIVPTATGMEKSIMDATASVRDYLQNHGFHNYDTQGLGNDEHGVSRPAYFVRPDTLEETKISLYRPKTKNGDPRIWLGRLGRYASPFNLLAILVYEDTLYAVNCSDAATLQSIHNPSSPLGKIAASRRPALNPAVAELLDSLRAIAAKGFIPTMRVGDTGIGMTLETLLGIPANAKKTPDYKGIEIKAKRLSKGSGNRVTLFSQVPNWKLSPIGSALKLLSTYGYRGEDGKLRLYHEINAKGPNSLGFMLKVDSGNSWLRQNHVHPDTNAIKHVTTWEMDTLRGRLAEKHPETFWVSALVKGGKANEEFHYIKVQHTRAPKIQNLDALLEGGLISVDYLMSQKGPTSVRDHGYLFKINPKDFDALFPPSSVHELLEV